MAIGASTRPMAATIAPVTTGGISRSTQRWPGDLHDDADQEIERAGGDDAAERQGDIGIGAADGSAGGNEHGADEGEARAEIARHPAADHEEEDDGGDARKQDRDVGIEPHEDGRQHRRAEHRDHVLQAHDHRLAHRQPLVRHDDPFGFQGPSRQETIGHFLYPPGYAAWHSTVAALPARLTRAAKRLINRRDGPLWTSGARSRLTLQPTKRRDAQGSQCSGRHRTQPLDREPKPCRKPLGDPARRRVDVYVPAGHDGRGLPLLVDLVGYTAGGPAHTNWKNYGENVPERLDRLIGTGAMPPVVVAFPDCFTRLGGNQYIDSSAMGRGRASSLTRCCPSSRNASAVAATAGAASSARARAATARSSMRLRHGGTVWSAAASHSGDVGFEFLYHLGEFAGALRHLAEHDMSIENFVRKFEAGPKAKDTDWHTMMVLAQAATFDPDPSQFYGIRLPVDMQHLRNHRGALGQLAALGSAAHGRRGSSISRRTCAS